MVRRTSPRCRQRALRPAAPPPLGRGRVSGLAQKSGTATGGAGPCRRGWARSTRFLRQGGGRRVAAHGTSCPPPGRRVCPACLGAVFSVTGYRANQKPREGQALGGI
jgi:hypothetical protein